MLELKRIRKIIPYVSQILLIFFSGINTYLVISYFGAEGKGNIAIIGSITQTAFTVLSSGVKQSFALKVKSDTLTYAGASDRSISLSLIVFALSFIFGLLVWISMNNVLYFVIALIIGVQVGTSYMGFAPLMRGDINAIYSLRLIPLAAVFLAMISGIIHTILAYFIVILFAWILVFSIYFIRYIKGLHFSLNVRTKDIWMSYPFAIAGILINLVFRFDLIQMKFLKVKIAEIGVYSLGVNFVDIFNAVTSVIITKIFISDLATQDTKKTIYLVRVSIISLLLGSSLLMFIHTFVLTDVLILMGSDWFGVIEIFPYLGIASLFMLSFNVLNAHMVSSYGETKMSYLPLLIGLSINIFLNQFLVPRYGIRGAGVATLVSYSLIFSTHFYYVKKYLRSKGF